jgi:hypothetical protein
MHEDKNWKDRSVVISYLGMRLARAFGTWDVLVDPGGDVLVVHGGSNTVIARHRTGHPVVLLSGEQPAALTSARLTGLLDLAAAVLTARETELLEHGLAALRRGELTKSTRVELV